MEWLTKWRPKANNNNYKPLPLKQRTSSVDARRDHSISAQSWYAVLGLLKIREYFITVDHFSIWRRHLAWAMEDGKSLKDYMTQRYASSTIFMSFLLGTEISTLFNSSVITTNMREILQQEQYWKIEFWIGIVIIFSAVLTLLSLISSYTAWGMVSSIDKSNIHCIFRSSIGQYVAELPGRLVVFSIYSFLLWIMMFFFVLLPIGYWSIALAAVSFLFFVHTISSFSAFGRVIMHSGGMAGTEIFDKEYEKNLLPHSLHSHLLAKARNNLTHNTSILRQYRYSNSRPIDHFFSEEELAEYMPGGDNGSSCCCCFLGGDGGNGNSDDDDGSDEVDNNNRNAHSDHPGLSPSYDNNTHANGQSNHHHFHGHDFENYHPTTTGRARGRTDSTVRFADEVVDMVTSSPPKSSSSSHHQRDDDNNRNETLISVQEIDTPVSQLSTTSLLTDSTTSDSVKTEESHASKSIPQNEQENIDSTSRSSSSSRPGMVRRDRSNTTATNSSDFDAALLYQSQPSRSKRPSPLPPTHKVPTNRQPASRTESDSVVANARKDNARGSWFFSGSTSSQQNNRNSSDSVVQQKRASTGSLPPVPAAPNAPGLSVLENAAKMQRQWRNSYAERSGSSEVAAGPPPPPPQRASFSERETSLQQLWINSSPTISNARKGTVLSSSSSYSPTISSTKKGNTSNLQHRDSFGSLHSGSSTPRNQSPVPPFPPPPPPPANPAGNDMPLQSRNSSSALSSSSSRGSQIESILSQEEEEEFRNDYGSSLEQLPAVTATTSVHSNKNNNEKDGRDGTNEASSLLDHDQLMLSTNAAAQGYYNAVDDTIKTPLRQRSSMDPWSKT